MSYIRPGRKNLRYALVTQLTLRRHSTLPGIKHYLSHFITGRLELKMVSDLQAVRKEIQRAVKIQA